MSIPVIPVYDPKDWLASTYRSLKAYVETYIDTDIYDIRFSYPEPDKLAEEMPFPRTIIHFEVESFDPIYMGYGPHEQLTEWDDDAGTISKTEDQWISLVFNIGVWASDRSGGETARLTAAKHLWDLFDSNSSWAGQALEDEMGAQIINYTGGQFVNDDINGQSVLRIADTVLYLRIFGSRTLMPVPFIQSFDIEGNIEMSDLIQIPVS